jgi:hypothetical protein
VDWKNHPVIIAAISAASSAVFCITFVLPIYEKKNINQIEDLKLQTTKLKEKNAKILKNEEDLLLKLKSSKQKILHLQEEDRFSKDSPLPKGFRDIYPFDLVDRVFEHYKSENIETEKRWYSVKVEDNLFSSATYYRLKHKNKEYISHIFFHFNRLSSLKDDYSIRPESEILQHTQSIRKATSKTLQDRFGSSKINDDGDEVFEVDKIWRINLSDAGIVIDTLYSLESFLEAMSQSCPVPESKISNK